MQVSAVHPIYRGPCLVVEDSRFDQERIARILARNFPSMGAVFVSTLEEAQTVVETLVVSLILLDNNLPDGKGANFAMQLHEDPDFKRIPIIMVSDWPSPFMFHKAELADVVQVLNKREFSAAHIHNVLNGRMRPRQAQLLH